MLNCDALQVKLDEERAKLAMSDAARAIAIELEAEKGKARKDYKRLKELKKKLEAQVALDEKKSGGGSVGGKGGGGGGDGGGSVGDGGDSGRMARIPHTWRLQIYNEVRVSYI